VKANEDKTKLVVLNILKNRIFDLLDLCKSKITGNEQVEWNGVKVNMTENKTCSSVDE